MLHEPSHCIHPRPISRIVGEYFFVSGRLVQLSSMVYLGIYLVVTCHFSVDGLDRYFIGLAHYTSTNYLHHQATIYIYLAIHNLVVTL